MKLPHNQGTFTLTSLQHFSQKGLILCLPFIPHLPAEEDKEMTSLKNTGARPTWPLPLDDRKKKTGKKKSGYCPSYYPFCILQWKNPLARIDFSFLHDLFLFSLAFVCIFIPAYDVPLGKIWQLVHSAGFLGDHMLDGRVPVYWLVKMGLVFLKLTFWLLCHPRL